jgi:hypothetical protein
MAFLRARAEQSSAAQREERQKARCEVRRIILKTAAHNYSSMKATELAMRR